MMLAAVPPLGLGGAYNNIFFDLLCVAYFEPILTKKRRKWGINTISYLGVCPKCPSWCSKGRHGQDEQELKVAVASIQESPTRGLLGNPEDPRKTDYCPGGGGGISRPYFWPISTILPTFGSPSGGEDPSGAIHGKWSGICPAALLLETAVLYIPSTAMYNAAMYTRMSSLAPRDA
jgi:hypothetical protein